MENIMTSITNTTKRELTTDQINDFLLEEMNLPLYLQARELCILSGVSKKHQKNCSVNSVWKRLIPVHDIDNLAFTSTIKRKHLQMVSQKTRMVEAYYDKKFDASQEIRLWAYWNEKVQLGSAAVGLIAWTMNITPAISIGMISMDFAYNTMISDHSKNKSIFFNNTVFPRIALVAGIAFANYTYYALLVTIPGMCLVVKHCSPKEGKNFVYCAIGVIATTALRLFSSGKGFANLCNTYTGVIVKENGVNLLCEDELPKIAGMLNAGQVGLKMLFRVAKRRMLDQKISSLVDTVALTALACTGVGVLPALAIGVTGAGLAKSYDISIVPRKVTRSITALWKKVPCTPKNLLRLWK